MFEGAYTAIVTPFDRKGRVDYPRLKDCIEMQIRSGINGIVPAGTTGESPTLDVQEHCKVVEFSVECARRRIKVIAGTGANSTEEAIELTRYAQQAGADGTLQVTPYYNKPNQEGLYQHFSKIADLGLPVMLYNIPSRTGREIAVDTVMRLARHSGIVALKEAGGSIDRVSTLVRKCRLTILSGDDSLTLPMMAVGAKGVVSVASNIIPGEIARMTNFALQGRFEQARRIHLRYVSLFNNLFIDTNPIPVKAAMAMMGLITEMYRLPLCPMSRELKTKLRACLRKQKLI